MKSIKYALSFGVGAAAYTVIEILWRGHTHWSMSIAGGASVCLIYMWNERLGSAPRALKYLVGALSVTAVELLAGCIVNLWLHLDVWDYSAMKFNFLGQITPLFSAAWYLLSIPAFYVCDIIKKHVDV